MFGLWWASWATRNWYVEFLLELIPKKTTTIQWDYRQVGLRVRHPREIMHCGAMACRSQGLPHRRRHYSFSKTSDAARPWMWWLLPPLSSNKLHSSSLRHPIYTHASRTYLTLFPLLHYDSCSLHLATHSLNRPELPLPCLALNGTRSLWSFKNAAEGITMLILWEVWRFICTIHME